MKTTWEKGLALLGGALVLLMNLTPSAVVFAEEATASAPQASEQMADKAQSEVNQEAKEEQKAEPASELIASSEAEKNETAPKAEEGRGETSTPAQQGGGDAGSSDAPVATPEVKQSLEEKKEASETLTGANPLVESAKEEVNSELASEEKKTEEVQKVETSTLEDPFDCVKSGGCTSFFGGTNVANGAYHLKSLFNITPEDSTKFSRYLIESADALIKDVESSHIISVPERKKILDNMQKWMGEYNGQLGNYRVAIQQFAWSLTKEEKLVISELIQNFQGFDGLRSALNALPLDKSWIKEDKIGGALKLRDVALSLKNMDEEFKKFAHIVIQNKDLSLEKRVQLIISLYDIIGGLKWNLAWSSSSARFFVKLWLGGSSAYFKFFEDTTRFDRTEVIRNAIKNKTLDDEKVQQIIQRFVPTLWVLNFCSFDQASGDKLVGLVNEKVGSLLKVPATYDANNNTAKVVLKKKIKDEDLKKIKNTGLFVKLAELGVKEVKFAGDAGFTAATQANVGKLAEQLVKVGEGLEAAGKEKFEYKVEFEAKVEKADCLESDPIKFVIEIEREAYPMCEFTQESGDKLVGLVNEKVGSLLKVPATYDATQKTAKVVLKKEIKDEDLKKIKNTGLFAKLGELGVKEVKFAGDAEFTAATQANVNKLLEKLVQVGEGLEAAGKNKFEYKVEFEAKVEKADCLESDPIKFVIEIEREAYPMCEFTQESGDKLVGLVNEKVGSLLKVPATYDANKNTAKVVLKKEIKDEDLKKIKNTGLFVKLAELGVKEVKFAGDSGFTAATQANVNKLVEKLAKVTEALEKAGKNKFEYKVEFEAKIEKADCRESEPIKFVIEIEREAYTYTVDFVDGTSSFLKKEVVHNNVVDKPTKNPEKAGYRFVGWFADKDFKTQFDFTKPITAHTTIYVKWNRISSGGGGWGGGGSSSSSSSSSSSTSSIASTTGTAVKEVVLPGEVSTPTCSIEGSVFSAEQNGSYLWACGKDITTIRTITGARLDEPLTRAELAKMMSVYVTQILGKDKVLTGTVQYPDVDEKLGDLAQYIQLAYQLQIMGIDAEGKALPNFMPHQIVTRAEFATVFSRVLWGLKHNQAGEFWYAKHLEALKEAKILTNTIPMMQEIRGRVLLMLHRSQASSQK